MSFAARPMLSGGFLNIYNGTITCGSAVVFTFTFKGFYPAIITGASVSPAALTTGYTIGSIYDTTGPTNYSSLSLSGFGATDPLQDYIYDITVNGVSKTSSTATNYNFSSGTATWQWTVASPASLWGIPTSGTVSAVILK
jgi:hypothetical protein